MSTVTRQVEFRIRVGNEPASLGKMIATIASCGAKVVAAPSYCDNDGAVVLIVSDDECGAARAIEAAGFKCRTNSVVLVEMPDKPGLAVLLGAKLAAANISILYSYSFRSERNQSYVVFKTTDDDRAIYLLEVEALIRDLAAAKSGCQPVPINIQNLHAEPLVA